MTDKNINALYGGELSLPFGVARRNALYDGENSYFKSNPHVAGMAADDDNVILNPYSANSPMGQHAVALNEAARVHMRRNNIDPGFRITDQQRAQFAGTPYQNNERAIRETIAARVFSGDPSALDVTPDQMAFAELLKRQSGALRGGR